MKLWVRCALPVLLGLTTAACTGPVGSCLFTSDAGYDYCEDFLGTEFNSSAAENSCATGNGAYASSPCSIDGALGTCLVGSGTAQDARLHPRPRSRVPAALRAASSVQAEAAGQAASRQGRMARSRVPLPGVLSISRLTSRRAARSRAPTNPSPMPRPGEKPRPSS
jgi:hypothetical protein